MSPAPFRGRHFRGGPMGRGWNHYGRVSESEGLMLLSVLMSPDSQDGAATFLGVLLSPRSPQEWMPSPVGAAKLRRSPENSECPVGPPQAPQVSQGSCPAQHAQERGSHGAPGPNCCHPTVQEQQPREQHLPLPRPPRPTRKPPPQPCPLPAAVPVPKAPEPSSPACPGLPPLQRPGVGRESSGHGFVLLQ